jgi:hypothetical protein
MVMTRNAPGMATEKGKLAGLLPRGEILGREILGLRDPWAGGGGLEPVLFRPGQFDPERAGAIAARALGRSRSVTESPGFENRSL